ncbi:helix-turn-helix domain-containing protein [Nonomuraea spiralis]|uniref:helix-turn-helix domain-containing protein n=1 Tax=Nonomuraea spiralis TaxID=46182 RepID=UPI0037A36FFA
MPAEGAEPVVVPADLWKRREMMSALTIRDIGHVFRLVRQYVGVSQTRIGVAVGLSQGKVSEIMKGAVQVTSFEVFERVAEGLQMPDLARMTLGLAPRNTVPRSGHQEEVTAESQVRTDLPSRYLANLTGASSRAVISGLRHVLAGHIQAEAIMGPPLLIRAVRSQIPVVAQVCQVTRGTDRAEALTFASELLEFCGWLHQDIGDFAHAMMWTNKALDYAMELGDQRIISYVLMRKSNIAIESGDHGHGVGLANAALIQPQALTPRLRAVILRTRAIANAHLGDAASSGADSDAALVEAIAGTTQEEDDCAPYCTPAYVAMETGATRLLLGQAAAAIPIFESSRSQWSLTSQARDHALLLARTATAYAVAGERDQACSLIEEAMPYLHALRSSRVASQLTTLQTHMSQWTKDPYVAELLTRFDVTTESFSLPAP